jgi:glycosyltransferase involved in cell wall biosynthesis
MKRNFAIGIPTLNRFDLLINALSKYSHEFPNTKIFVIDNGNQQIESANKNIIIFKTEKNLGVAASWNKLAEEIFKEHEYALILNDDIILDAGEVMIAELLKTCLSDLIVCESEPGFTGFSSFVLPKKTYNKKIGVFDEKFYPAYYEDNDYLYRLKLANANVEVSSLLNPERVFRFGTQLKDPTFDLRMNQNRNYYIKKWGGMPGKECVTEPFAIPAIKKKILWVTEYMMNSGYSRVSESLLKYLSQEYDITVLDTYRLLEGHYTVLSYPAGEKSDPVKVVGRLFAGDTHGIEQLKLIYQDYDMVFMIQDVWHINLMIEGMIKAGKPLPPLIAYFPIECVGHDPDWYRNFHLIDAPVTYTEFAKEEVERVLNYVYKGAKYAEQVEKIKIVTHGIDTEVFYKLPGTMNELRQKALGTDRFNDQFIFLNANRNIPRKKPDLTMDAFSILLRDHPELKDKVQLCMHCGNEDSYINITKYARRVGIVNNLIITTTTGMPQLSDGELNLIYNICQVGLNTALGEGFALTNAEHAAAGGAQIVPVHSATGELYSDYEHRGLLTPTAHTWTMTSVMTTGCVIDVEVLALQMYEFIVNEKLYQEHSKNCQEYFTSKRFNWKNIAKSWQEIFDLF